MFLAADECRELVPRSSAPLLFTAQVVRVPAGVGGVFDCANLFVGGGDWGEQGKGVPTLALTGTWSRPVFGPVRHAPSCAEPRTAGAGRDEVSWEPWAVAPDHGLQ